MSRCGRTTRFRRWRKARGVPVTFSSDREYNAWGGYIDTPHDAFATAGNVELAEKLWKSYSEQTRAVGYHVLFHPLWRGNRLVEWRRPGIHRQDDRSGSQDAGATVEETLAATGPGILYVDGVKEAVEQGLITEERLEASARRVLRAKFNLGLFENPYSDGQKALALSASEAFLKEKWGIVDNETLAAARNPEEVALEKQLMAESAVLVKNVDNLLPLQKGIKVYITSTSTAATLGSYKKYIGNYAMVVEDIEEADVVIADCTQFNDAAELAVEDAQDAEKKLVLIANSVDPDTWAMTSADAVLFLNFSRPADHGTGVSGISTLTKADVFADLLFGERQPNGHIVKEIARDEAMDNEQWQDLTGDQGLDTYTRLILEGTMLTSENFVTPNNWGDPLLQYKYGMHYGEQAQLRYSALVLPKVAKEVETESSGSTSVSIKNVVEAKVGVPFTVHCLVWNDGADGVENVQVKEGDKVLAEKLMALTAGSWRVLKLDVTFDTPGEHTITIGNLSATINIAE